MAASCRLFKLFRPHNVRYARQNHTRRLFATVIWNLRRFRRRLPSVKRWHLLLLTVSIALPAALFFVMPPALARLLLWPGFRVSTVLRINSGDFAPIAMQVVVGWVLCAVLTALFIAVVQRILWPRKTLFVICALVLLGVIFIEARAERNREYEGTWEQGFERSSTNPETGY